MGLLRLVTVVLLVVSLSSAAQAQQSKTTPDKSTDYAAAKRHYTAAEKAVGDKDWNLAAKEYGIAYEITHDPVLFFKLGNAYQSSGDCTRAVEYLERYLSEAKPSEEYQLDAKARIAACHATGTANAESASTVQSSGEAAPTTDAAGNRPLEPSLTEENTSIASDVTATGDELASPQLGDTANSSNEPSFMEEEVTWQQTAGWTSMGVSVAFLTASAVLGLSANSREEDIENLLSYRDAGGRPTSYEDTVSERYETLADEGDALSRMSLIALGGAGISAAAAIVFFVLDESSEEEDNAGLGSLTPAIGHRSVGVRLRF